MVIPENKVVIPENKVVIPQLGGNLKNKVVIPIGENKVVIYIPV